MPTQSTVDIHRHAELIAGVVEKQRLLHDSPEGYAAQVREDSKTHKEREQSAVSSSQP